ncbi:MAG TPA: cytochrome B [Cyclobacteriaceae bacterium]|nr:cytochrome B [Cyclobacteriaceae bacterium]
MVTGLLHTHSLLRYLVLILLLAVIVKSFLGFANKKAFAKIDNTLGLTLFSVTHTQLLVGLILYFVSPRVMFSGAAMKDPVLRYWLTEHSVMMLTAIVLITLARTTSKKMSDDTAKHKRIFIFNTIALIIILVAIAMSNRGFFSLPGEATSI